MIKLATAALGLILCFSQPLQSQSLFQNSGGAARTIGLGGPHALGPIDATTALWNPAGLAGLRDREFILASNRPFEFSAAGLVGYWPEVGSVGLSFARFALSNVNLERAGLAWARALNKPFSFGFAMHGNRLRQEEFATASLGAIWHPRGERLPLSRDPYQASFFNIPLTTFPWAFAIQANDMPLGRERLASYYAAGVAARFKADGPSFLASYEWRGGKNITRLGAASPVFAHFALYGGFFDFKVEKAALGLAGLGDAYSFDVIYSFADKKFLSGVAFRLGPKPAERARQNLSRGMALAKTSNYRGARKQFKHYLAYEPENAKVLKLDSALTAQIQREDERIAALMDEGVALEKKFMYVDAAVKYITVLQSHRAHKTARRRLSRLTLQLDSYIKRQYRNAVQLFDDGNYLEAKKLFENILLVAKNYADAHEYLNRIESYQREEAEKMFVRGLGYYEQEKFSSARDHFQQALTLSPNYERAQAYLDSSQTKWEEQKAKISRLLAEAERLNRRQQYVRAYRNYREALALDPANDTAKQGIKFLQNRIDAEVSEKLQAANRAFERGDYSQASDLGKQILDLAPKHEDANNLMQRINQINSRRAEDYVRRGLDYFDAKDWNNAVEEFDKALNSDPKNRLAEQKRQEALSQSDIQQLFAQAQAQYNRNQFLKAIEFYKTILARDPQNVTALARLNECQRQLDSQVDKYFKRGLNLFIADDYEGAIEELDKALGINPRHKQSLEYKQKAQQSLEALRRLRE
jgi:tetratricopeptide (TPR) repeat protein